VIQTNKEVDVIMTGLLGSMAEAVRTDNRTPFTVAKDRPWCGQT